MQEEILLFQVREIDKQKPPNPTLCKMFRFTTSKLLNHSLDLLKGTFLHSIGFDGSACSNPTNQLKRFGSVSYQKLSNLF